MGENKLTPLYGTGITAEQYFVDVKTGDIILSGLLLIKYLRQ